MNEWLAKLPSTNARIATTLFLALLTTLRYLSSGMALGAMQIAAWQPSESWLIFLAAMSGLDLAQFYAKRKTYDETSRPPSPPDNEDKQATPEPEK